MNILILGAGQSLRGDDAVGLETVRLWREQFPETARGVRVELSELPGLALLELLDGMDAAILVDAVHSSAPAGTLHRLGPDELASFTPGSGSAHGWGVAETLQLGRSLYPALANCRVTLLGIEAGQVEMGAGLSQAVRETLPDAARLLEQEVRSLL